MRIAGQRHLVPVNGARPRPGHRHPPPAQGHRPPLAAVAHRGPAAVVLALRPARLADLGLKHRLHHRHPGGHAQRQQPLPRSTGDVGHRQPDFLGQIRQRDGIGRVSEANSRYGLHGGPLLFLRVYLAVHPKTYHQAGLRRGTATSNSTKTGTTSLAVDDGLTRRLSPEQISHRLVKDFPDDESMRVSHETIYQALYFQARGGLKREVAQALRSGRTRRKPHQRPDQRTHRFVDPMIMISDRPAEIEDRALPATGKAT